MKNRWFILFACILINICLGAGYAWSVFQAPLMEVHGWSASQASLAFSIYFSMGPVAMIILGPLQDKYGPKWITFAGGCFIGLGMILTSMIETIPMLYVTYGVINGLGVGATYGCTTTTSLKAFPDKKGLAGGLAVAGYGSGALIFAPIARSLISSAGILSTFRYLGIAMAIVICIGSMFLNLPKTDTQVNSTLSIKDKKPQEMLSGIQFWLLWSIYVLGSISGLMIIGHASTIAQEHLGYTLAAATGIVMIVSIGNTLGRIFWGSVSDKLGRYPTVSLMFITSSIGLVLLFLNIQSIISVIGIVIIALCYGGFLGIFPGITADTWGSKYNGSNYGFMFSACAVAGFIGPSMAASFKESSGTYSMSFLISIALSLIGFILMMILSKKEKNKANI